MKTKLTALVLYLLFMLILLEGFAFFSWLILKDKVTFLSSHLIEPGRLNHLQSIYDRDSGWQLKDRLGEAGGFQSLFCFGDSFTYGDEVKAENSWPFLVHKKMKLDIYNGGQPAFGVDQAILAFEKSLEKVKRGDIVILAIISNNIIRALGTYRPFYKPQTGLQLTKPRFDLGKGGDLILLKNPIQRSQDIPKINTFEFLEELADQDYWMNESRLYARFPYSLNLLKDRFWKSIANLVRFGSQHGDTSLKFGDRYVKTLMSKMLERFFRKAESRGARPLFVHLPTDNDVLSYHTTQNMMPGMGLTKSLCEENAWDCFFPVFDQAFFSQLRLRDSFMPKGHYSPSSNEQFAASLQQELIRRGYINQR